jgi:sugar phosphate isomerase/epimerase
MDTTRGIERVLPAGTVEGVPVEVHLEVAAATGHDAVSLRPAHLRAWCGEAHGRTLEELAARLDDLGLVVSELDPVMGWSDPCPWPGGRLPDGILADLDMAAAVGARAVTALVAPGEAWDRGPGVAGFAALCAAAGDRGVDVQIEPFGWSELWDVVEAVAVTEQVDSARAGVMVDTWHLARRGGGVATVASLPVERVMGLQVSDGPAAPRSADLREDCFSARTWPGEPTGELHPELILESLLGRGWSGPVAVEVFGTEPPDPLDRARRSARAFDAVLDAP